MNVYELKTPRELLAGNSYAGRGIVIGKTPDGKKAAVAYFIMGRSENWARVTYYRAKERMVKEAEKL